MRNVSSQTTEAEVVKIHIAEPENTGLQGVFRDTIIHVRYKKEEREGFQNRHA